MKKIYGFTLVELMVTLAVAAILLTVAVPSFQTTIRNNRTTTQANDLLLAFNTSRLEAVRRSSNVTVCSSSNMTTCAGTNDWRIGWITFQDLDADGVFEDDGDALLCEVNAGGEALEDCLIRIRKALPTGTTFVATNGVSAPNWRITFNSTGVINNPATGNNPTTSALDPIVLTLKSSGCGDGEERRISVNNLGRSNIRVRDC